MGDLIFEIFVLLSIFTVSVSESIMKYYVNLQFLFEDDLSQKNEEE